MTTRPDELEAFKSLNLTEIAASYGFELDRRASCPTSIKMKHPDGDALVIGRDPGDGHWIYFSVHEDHSGSAIDLVQHREGVSLGLVRVRLRPFLSPATRPEFLAAHIVADVRPITRDLLSVRAAYEAAQEIAEHHAYLCDVRHLPPALLASTRFCGRVRTDARGNALFPHWGQHDGQAVLCGFEIKNSGFTGFAPGGTKGLWGSRTEEGDRSLVIAETAIDALSYAALHGYEHSRFVSIAGQMNPQQPKLLISAIRKLPPEAQVILALDNDDGGDQIARQLFEIFAEADRIDLRLLDDRPPTAGDDWNDVLRGDAAIRHEPEPR